jgi:hypothetical protein
LLARSGSPDQKIDNPAQMAQSKNAIQAGGSETNRTDAALGCVPTRNNANPVAKNNNNSRAATVCENKVVTKNPATARLSSNAVGEFARIRYSIQRHDALEKHL